MSKLGQKGGSKLGWGEWGMGVGRCKRRTQDWLPGHVGVEGPSFERGGLSPWPSFSRKSGSEKRGLLEKGSLKTLQESRIPGDFGEPLACGKQKRIRPSLEILGNLEIVAILKIPLVKRSLFSQ